MGDITTDLLVNQQVSARAYIKAKENGIIAGLPAAAFVYEILDPCTKQN